MAKKKPAKGKAFGDIVARWDLIIKEVEKVDLPNNPHLQAPLDKLKADLALAFDLNNQQESVKGQLASLTQQIEALLFKSGNADFAALYDLIRAIYGRRSPELKRYVPVAEGEVDKTKKGWGDGKPPTPVEPK